MLKHIHPDYDYDVMPLADYATQAPVLEALVNDLALDVQELPECEARYWLGTLLIDGKVCQAQIVVTSIDSHFVDEV
jgi:hypothetical protein